MASGRDIKRRLYRLSLIGNHIGRIKHFRGHGVHSPYIYGLVRSAFMNKALDNTLNTRLYNELLELGLSQKRAIQLQKAMLYCNYQSYSINQKQCTAQFNIFTDSYPTQALQMPFNNAMEHGTTMVIIAPYFSAERIKVIKELIDAHRSTSVDNRGYIIFFNNHLPKQHYRL